MKDFKRGGGFGNKKSGGFRDRQSGNFGGRDSGSRGFNRGASASARPAMYEAVCAECGKSCEVPFRPSGNRPVYCSNCFKGKEGARPGQSDRNNDRSFSKPSFGGTSEQFDKLNAKLDKILNILNSIAAEVEEGMDEQEEFDEEKNSVPAAPKKAAGKKGKKK
jgi:CxxC-x17-CxxC domain-containing protein